MTTRSQKIYVVWLGLRCIVNGIKNPRHKDKAIEGFIEVLKKQEGRHYFRDTTDKQRLVESLVALGHVSTTLAKEIE